ncbi:hypothetical protein RR48_11520 [Papilio machaon]|uniref:Uncharacterized protein n=1 Tax=Papilio machaon TaxID=76193 RepID=A0A194R413_PAPMA|nr:hypothetical protein RR48_11520 [Papilio machaon]
MPAPDYSVELELGEPAEQLLEHARLHCGEDDSTRLQAIYELKDIIYVTVCLEEAFTVSPDLRWPGADGA